MNGRMLGIRRSEEYGFALSIFVGRVAFVKLLSMTNV
jgi:hypothetical protein